MKKKAIFTATMNLINALEQAKSLTAEAKLPSKDLEALLARLNTVLVENSVDLGKEPYKGFNSIFAEGFTVQNLDSLIDQLQGFFTELEIKIPQEVFILTAPFDEDAKTGDGQYAKSLVEGFKRFNNGIPCTWLKLENKDYEIPVIRGLKSIPEGIVPTVAALQPLANGKTFLSRYQLTGNDFEAAKEFLKNNLTVRTPQLLYNSNNDLQWVGYTDGSVKKFFNLDEVKNARGNIAAELEKKKEEHEELHKEEEKFVQEKKVCTFLSKRKIDYAKASREEKGKILTEINEYLEKENINKRIRDDKYAVNNIADLVKELKGPLAKTEERIKEVNQKIKELEEVDTLLEKLANQFNSAAYNENELIKILNRFSGITSSCYDLNTQTLVTKEGKKPSTINIFNEALAITKNDPIRQGVIDLIKQTMKTKGAGKKCSIDIHIRPPDTGAFIMPEDILAIQALGITVNLTIHEYKQNYTRPFLQQFTHGLLKVADSVLFFNEKDQSNAVKASINGDVDRTHHQEKYWPIAPYDLKSKAELTVASQVLSGTPKTPEEVIKKEPNILSFGTIRPGKGFEEALDIAKEIKKRADRGSSSNAEGESSPAPTFPKVILAGDPQFDELMQDVFETRYGKELVLNYQRTNPFNFSSEQSKERRTYWKAAKTALEEEVATTGVKLNNPYLEIHPWCEPHELDALKERSKYVVRMDEMGMRNNGSAIISVLDVGVVLTKWGCVTDPDYYPQAGRTGKNDSTTKGIFGDAVDLGMEKYGLNRDKKEWIARDRIYSNYKRADRSRDPIALLNAIMEREEDQRRHSNNLSESKNYKTVVVAQELLTSKFTLRNLVNNLIGNLATTMDRAQALPRVEVTKPKNKYAGLGVLSELIRQRAKLSRVEDGQLISKQSNQTTTIDDEEEVISEEKQGSLVQIGV